MNIIEVIENYLNSPVSNHRTPNYRGDVLEIPVPRNVGRAANKSKRHPNRELEVFLVFSADEWREDNSASLRWEYWDLVIRELI